MKFQDRLDCLSPSARSLYGRLKGVYNLNIKTLKNNCPGEELRELQDAQLMYVYSKGGVIVFNDEADIRNKHPIYIEQRKEDQLARYEQKKELEEMLIDVANLVGMEALKHKLLVMCGVNDFISLNDNHNDSI